MQHSHADGASTSRQQTVRLPEVVPNGADDENYDALEDCPLNAVTAASPQSRSKHVKASKLIAFCQQITLRRLFRLIGYSIGTNPFAYVIAAVIISAMSFGIYYLKLEDRVRDGYTPTTSPSRRETDLLRDFTGSIGDPTLTTVVLQSRDGGSMHRVDYLRESARLHRFFVTNFTANVPSTGEQFTYAQICGALCDANIVIEYFYRALIDEYNNVKAGKAINQLTDLTYPIAKVSGFDMHLERNLYGVRLRSSNATAANKTEGAGANGSSAGWPNDSEAQIMSKITNIEHIQVIFMTFQGLVSTPDTEAKLNAWEVAVYDYATNNYANQPIKMLVLGAEIVNQELIKDSQRMAPYFVAGFLTMFLLVAVSVIGSSIVFGLMHPAKLIVAVGVIACPVLAITVTFGLFALAQLRTNTIMLIMPFLVMGIGVNGAFLVIHSWMRTTSECTTAECLGYVLEKAGPSITISTLTNVITFGIGAMTPTPEISLFCFETAIALAFAYIFTLVLLCPLLCVATVLEKKRSKDAGCSMVRRWMRSALKLYCWLIMSKPFGALAFVGILIYWYFGVIGALNIETRLDVKKLLPKNSPLQEANAIVSNLVWTEYYPVTVLVNSPLDLRDQNAMRKFDAMVDEFEEIEKCRGKQFTLLWLRDYKHYWNEAIMYNFDYFTDDSASTASSIAHHALDYSKLDDFLFSPLYKHWANFLKLRPNKELPVERFWFLVAYQNSTSWAEHIQLMQQWRAIANSYSDLNVSVWEANSMFVDQMLSLKTLALQTCVWTLICMTAVCALFIRNPFSVIIASLTIASISFGVIGFLSYWQLDLDPATLCAILMCIGMSVDFTAHVSYHYQLGEKKVVKGRQIMKRSLDTNRARLEYTMESVAWPTLQGGISTVACILPLAFLENYIPMVFVKTISLVVIWGLFHGLVLLPTFLSLIPRSLLEINCYRSILGQRHQVQRSSAADSDERFDEPEKQRVTELRVLASNPTDGN